MEEIKNMVQAKVNHLKNVKKSVEQSLKQAPKGSLVVSHSHGNEQYYYKTDLHEKKGVYISKDKRKLAERLAQKDYDLQVITAIDAEIMQLNKVCGLLKGKDYKKVYENLSDARKKLVKPYCLTDEQYSAKWESECYIGKEITSNTPVIITERGERVRSKTEKILADKFYALGIPYRYEYPLKVNGYGVIYPDFMLLNVKKRKEIYFEHFGMMDSPQYSQNAVDKIELYAKNGIFQGKDLLITYETLRKPLNMEVVERMLKEFIL